MFSFAPLLLSILLSVMCITPISMMAAPLEVFVTIPPLAFLVKSVGGDEVHVENLVAEGQNPHTFEVTPQTMKKLLNVALYVKIGEHFESILLKKMKEAHPKLSVVDSSAHIPKRVLEGDEEEGDEEQSHGHHHHEGGRDPHIWTSPLHLQRMGATVTDALIRLRPHMRKRFLANYETLKKNLQEKHNAFQKLFSPYKGKAIYTYHPDFGYFTDLYGLKQVCVEQGGKTPSPKVMMRLVEELKQKKVKTLFVQPQFDARSAKMIAEALSGQVVELNPMRYEILDELDHIAAAFAKALSGH